MKCTQKHVSQQSRGADQAFNRLVVSLDCSWECLSLDWHCGLLLLFEEGIAEDSIAVGVPLLTTKFNLLPTRFVLLSVRYRLHLVCLQGIDDDVLSAVRFAVLDLEGNWSLFSSCFDNSFLINAVLFSRVASFALHFDELINRMIYLARSVPSRLQTAPVLLCPSAFRNQTAQ